VYRRVNHILMSCFEIDILAALHEIGPILNGERIDVARRKSL
jgi:hypothetical protein